jgi:hypothetical protein
MNELQQLQQAAARVAIGTGVYIAAYAVPEMIAGPPSPVWHGIALVASLAPPAQFAVSSLRRAGLPLPHVPLGRRRTLRSRRAAADGQRRWWRRGAKPTGYETTDSTEQESEEMRTTKRPRQMPRNEADYITHVLYGEYGIRAGVQASIATPSFIYYQLHLGSGEKIKSISERMPDVERRIREWREKQGQIEFDANGMRVAASVRLDTERAALEVSRHDRKPLPWSKRDWPANPFTSLAGRNYDATGGYPVVIDLNRPDNAHTLVAGATGSGKSVTVYGIMAGFAESTPPTELEILPVDLDDDKIKVFERLPHVPSVARDYESAVAAIRYAADAMDNGHPRRILLVVDELALLVTTDKNETGDIFDMLADIAQRGRKHGVHMLLATQKPLSEQIGPIVKSNIQVRMCGAVTSHHDSNTVLSVAGCGAEKLPGWGSFIYRCGGSIYRIQTYYIEDLPRVVADIAAKWGGSAAPVAPPAPVRSAREPKTAEMGANTPLPSGAPVLHQGMHHQAGASAPPVHHPAPVSPQSSAPVAPPAPVESAPVFPLDEKRELTPEEAAAVRAMYDGGMSKNALCNEVYGSKSTRYMSWINDALDSDEKIVQLRRSQ